MRTGVELMINWDLQQRRIMFCLSSANTWSRKRLFSRSLLLQNKQKSLYQAHTIPDVSINYIITIAEVSPASYRRAGTIY